MQYWYYIKLAYFNLLLDICKTTLSSTTTTVLVFDTIGDGSQK